MRLLSLKPATRHVNRVGAHVWNAGIALAKYITLAGDLELAAGRMTLELGAGCGLVSIVAAGCGAAVLATDKQHALDALRRNCATASGTIQVELLEFGQRPSFPATLVLASDVLYACAILRCCYLMIYRISGRKLCATWSLKRGTLRSP